ncbi:MAG: ATP-binding protein [Gemmatimonadales bacterium]
MRAAHWELAALGQAVALGRWLVDPALGWALAIGALGVVVVLGAVMTRRALPILTALAVMGVAAAAIDNAREMRAVERSWPATRRALVERASRGLGEALDQAVERARAAAAQVEHVRTMPRAAAFRELSSMVSTAGPETGVAVFDSNGAPLVWAGRHRLAPDIRGPELSLRTTAFYAVLEARRQAGSLIGVGQVLLAADSAVPDREGAVASLFERKAGASLEFFAAGSAPAEEGVLHYCVPRCPAEMGDGGEVLFSVRTVPPAQGERKLALVAAGGRRGTVLGLVVLVLLSFVGGALGRWGGLSAIVGLLVLTPAGRHVGAETLFSSATYYLGTAGPFSASQGALLVSAGLGLVGVFSLARRKVGAWGMWLAGLIVIAAPVVMRHAASGITLPFGEIGIGLWLSWELGLATVGILLGLVAGALVSQRFGRHPPTALPLAGVLAGVVLAVVGLLVWDPAGWPFWYAPLWVPVAALAILPQPRVRHIVSVALVAGTAASLLTWSTVIEGRMLLAGRDASRLSEGDPVAIGLLDQFGGELETAPVPASGAALYAVWRESPLSQDDYPAVLTTWNRAGGRIAVLELADLGLETALLRFYAREAMAQGKRVLEVVHGEGGVRYVISVPLQDQAVVTVGLAPRSELIPPVRVARFLRGERRLVEPYEMFLGEAGSAADSGSLEWERTGWVVRGRRILPLPTGARSLNIGVSLGSVPQLFVRGALVLLLDCAVVVLLWLVADALTGRIRAQSRSRLVIMFRSYRLRLTVALAGFFVTPTLGFAAWSAVRLRAEAARSRDLVTHQTLSDAAGSAAQLSLVPRPELSLRLDLLASRLGADLLWYEGGVLTAASVAVLDELGLLGRFMPPEAYRALMLEDEMEVTSSQLIGGQLTRVGYRLLGGPRGAGPVLAVPRLVDVTGIQHQQEDLALGILLATFLGVAAAAGLAALAARSLSHPVQSLRAAAVAVGRGEPVPPFGPDIPTEFVPVVDSFERMARDVRASQAALETARRRTAAVLANVATAVIAVDREMKVSIANPRAKELLDARLESGEAVAAVTGSEWSALWNWVREFMGGGRELDQQEFLVGTRRVRAQVASLHGDQGGCVVALDDTTELTHAVRVLAWGELARQVAHEIKNPLTPIRLGMQHLQRARRDGSPDFDSMLERTGRQILSEIERLDAIARAFARFGAPPAEAEPLETAELSAIVEDAADLYALGGGTQVLVQSAEPVEARVRKDELKEVLINLIENARDAGAAKVSIRVERGAGRRPTVVIEDDGRGISKEHLVRVFEPQFSTTTSGTGLGLAICKRLVEGWGAEIDVRSELGRGTTVRIVF